MSILKAIQNILMMELCETREICVGWVLRATLLCSHKLNPDVFLQAKTRDVVIPRLLDETEVFILVTVYNDVRDTVDVSCAVLAAVAEPGVALQKNNTQARCRSSNTLRRGAKWRSSLNYERETTFLETFSADILGDNTIDVRVTAYHQSSGGSFADTNR